MKKGLLIVVGVVMLVFQSCNRKGSEYHVYYLGGQSNMDGYGFVAELPSNLAGETITARLTKAPSNNSAIGGLKICTENGWFAARPSGTEDVYKIYAESFKGTEHLKQIQTEAKIIVGKAFSQAGV